MSQNTAQIKWVDYKVPLLAANITECVRSVSSVQARAGDKTPSMEDTMCNET